MADAALNTHEHHILENIQTHGCHVMSVFDPKGELPDFTYSIGFPATVGQPEVIVYGLPGKLAHSMVNETLTQCRAGLILADGIRIDGLLEGFACIVREILADRIDAEHFGSAMWFEHYRTGGRMTQAFQIVWPGARHGLFPWEASADLAEIQPALYEPRQAS
ncbi:DUF4262 domain-containing protein [Sphingomonas sp. Leaf4]|uniref:DUF4262 domain-containing protein n=1 Tax=Sphingomonas sp. Leaf4 TaxID=2876553 RepID=UPI001E3B8F47|nr:DUF4262 domain-containing protein [Sphingomonas sp. Leaf4]